MSNRKTNFTKEKQSIRSLPQSEIMKKSELHFKNNFDLQIDFKNCVLIYDQILEKKYKKFILKFSRRLSVQSGEQLKDISKLSSYIRKINALSSEISIKDLKIVAFGGCSVGDFSGFIASIYKRGVGFIQIPTTWLSAIDSAHGGKTALNLDGVKNQIGTFYPACSIYLIKEIFLQLPTSSLIGALGEYYKTGLIQGGSLWTKITKHPAIDSEFLWNLLPFLIQAKLKIVNQDPFEKKGIRAILNLGHTIGHVIESSNKLPHGTAVMFGLRFSYEFGRNLKITSEVPELEWMLPSKSELRSELRKIKNFKKILIADKKSFRKKKIFFIFIQNPGKMTAQHLETSKIVNEWKRQSK